MELKEFINNTLTQIAEGMQAAIDASEEGGYLVNPSTTKIGADCKIHFELSVESAARKERRALKYSAAVCRNIA